MLIASADLNVDTYYLEYDTPRAGGFEPLAYLPKHKNAVLGVVTSKFAKLEDQKDMIDRLNQAADFVAKGTGQTREQALKQLSVSAQCGFGKFSLSSSMSVSLMCGDSISCRRKRFGVQGHGC